MNVKTSNINCMGKWRYSVEQNFASTTRFSWTFLLNSLVDDFIVKHMEKCSTSNFIFLSNLFGKFLSILSPYLSLALYSMDDLGKVTYQCRKNKKSATFLLCEAPWAWESDRTRFKSQMQTFLQYNLEQIFSVLWDRVWDCNSYCLGFSKEQIKYFISTTWRTDVPQSVSFSL